MTLLDKFNAGFMAVNHGITSIGFGFGWTGALVITILLLIGLWWYWKSYKKEI